MNSNGFISARFDFTAFSEKISLGVGLRTIDQGYSAPQNSRQGYGLTETDSSTGLDHTWFRKNENRAGRWTSPDPYKGSMSLGSSGSFNRYSYVENQPTNFVDPSGLCTITYHYNAEGVLTGAVLSGDCAVTINGGGSRVMFGGGGFGSGGMFLPVITAGTELGEPGGGGGGPGSTPVIRAPRDKWYQFSNRDFQNWVHQCRKQRGQPDFSREELSELFMEWKMLGSPSLRRGDNCNGNGGNPNPTTVPVPAKEPTKQRNGSNEDYSTAAKVGTGVVVGVGAGYLIYRGVRLIPSLTPATFWTIPANLAIP